jgi:endonuclease/exonuclease/phosphatase family metal-dependent hydrolase
MRTRLVLAIAGLTWALAPVVARPVAAAATSSATTASPDVIVGTWNVGTVGASRNVPEHLPWREREPAVVKQIVAARVDVLGVQEVSQSLAYESRLVHGTTQFADLADSLNATGVVRYALTNDKRGASLNNRILYKPRKLLMLEQGSLVYHSRAAVGSGANRHLLRPRGMVWSVFSVRATGARFLFVDTHLQPNLPVVRLAQWHELLHLVKQLQQGHSGRPAIVVGDYNQSFCGTVKLDGPFRDAGIPNVLDGEQCSRRRPVRAETYHNIWLGSYNAFHRALSYKRNCAAGARSDQDPTPCVGRSLDSIFASTELKVPRYEAVADLNDAKTKLVGTIPSDHYLVEATLAIPK